MALDKMKPCPFCGGEAMIEEVNSNIGIGKTIDCVAFSPGCRNEECIGYQTLLTFSRRSDAIKMWNRRHEDGK